MSNFIGKEELVFCSYDTCKFNLNGYQIIAMGAADKQHAFHHVGFVLKSHGDEESWQWQFDKLKDEVSEKLLIAIAPWRSVNDYSPAILIP